MVGVRFVEKRSELKNGETLQVYEPGTQFTVVYKLLQPYYTILSSDRMFAQQSKSLETSYCDVTRGLFPMYFFIDVARLTMSILSTFATHAHNVQYFDASPTFTTFSNG